MLDSARSSRSSLPPPTRLGAPEELIGYLERDQLVADTSVPVPPARLSPGVQTALWVLRLFVIVVSAMVLYVFVVHLH